MSFSAQKLEVLLQHHEHVARVVVVKIEGSTPREVGAAMWVYPQGQDGTIGGGAMEFAAIAEAQALLQGVGVRVRRFALGPSLGQCCGGSVLLLFEMFDRVRLQQIQGLGFFARRLDEDVWANVQQNAVFSSRKLPALSDGWFIEAVDSPKREIWLYGAGHVGRAMVHHLLPLPQFAITWVDIDQQRFPAEMPDGVRALVAHSPAEVVRYAPDHAEHFIMTHNHALDLEICHQILQQESAFLGLIGSKSKAARFRKRLSALGHDNQQVAHLTSPIGDTALGKQPNAIALGVICDLLRSADVCVATLVSHRGCADSVRAKEELT